MPLKWRQLHLLLDTEGYEEIFRVSSLSHDIKINLLQVQANPVWTSPGMKHDETPIVWHVRFLFVALRLLRLLVPPTYLWGNKQWITNVPSRIHSHCTGCTKDRGSASPCPEADAGWCRLKQVEAGQPMVRGCLDSRCSCHSHLQPTYQ